MTAPRFDRITEPQRECLRLVLTRRNSKEIAQVLEISSFTVDKRLARACAMLGVSSRFKAARLLAAHEGNADAGGTYEALVYQSPDVVPDADPDTLEPSEALPTTDGVPMETPIWLPIRSKGGRVNTLTVWQRLLWIFTIPAALAVAVGMLGFGLSVVGKLLNVIQAAVS